MWTLELWALPVHVWSPLNETAQLSIYMGVCVCVYIYIYMYIYTYTDT
jgi:hypothetical protein